MCGTQPDFGNNTAREPDPQGNGKQSILAGSVGTQQEHGIWLMLCMVARK